MDTQSRDHDHSHCTFCDLIHGAAEVSICHEDADAIAFMDIQPVNNGHVLVVPREHYESLLDVPQEIGLHLFKVTMRIANAIRQVTGCEDLNIVVNSGAAAGQDEPHYHVHIIPRRAGDGFDIPLPFNGSEMPDRTLLDAYAARIGSALSDPMKVDHDEPPSGSRRRASVSAEKVAEQQPTMRADGGSRTERPVALPTFDESDGRSRTSSPRSQSSQPPHGPSRGRLREGAHGELRYDGDEADDAA